MTEQQNFGFGKFVPGFDFLQNLSKGASQPQAAALPSLSSWVAPTLNVEELDKRIGELKSVLFWLDQNSKALGATIQALELQKMTLATLKGMNFNLADIASALTAKGGTDTVAVAMPADAPVDTPSRKTKDPGKAASAGVVDPMQWWGALTQQFQEIAAGALKDVAVVAQQGASPAAQAATPARSTGAAKSGAAGKSAATKKASRKSSR